MRIFKIFNSIPKSPTPNQLQEIKKATWDQCAEWWDILNTWGWPYELLPSDGYVFGSGQKYESGGMRTKLRKKIEEKVGEKFVLHYLNVIKDKRMSEEEYEDFWRASRTDDMEAKERYSKYLTACAERRSKEIEENKSTHE